jgi:hypothetical protein
MTTKTLITATLALAALGSAGCFNRSHMSENYGRAYRQAFERQAVTPPSAVATSKFPKGLDALESGIVVETYRAQLAPKAGGASTDQGMILLSPNSGPLGYTPSSAPVAPAK